MLPENSRRRPAQNGAPTEYLMATTAESIVPREPAYDRVVRALLHVGVKVQNVGSDRARAQCPVHDSRGLTLSVRRGDGRVLVHCFAGCDDTEILAVLGLEVRDLFDGDVPAGYVPAPRREPRPFDIVTEGAGVNHLLHRIAVEHGIESTPPSRPEPEYRMPAEVAADYAAWVREEWTVNR